MSYEAWRATFKSSEHAARAAYADAQRFERLFAAVIMSLVNVGRTAGVRGEDQLNGNLEIITAIEKLKQRRDKWKARALKAEQWNREMVANAANNSLEGYSELGRTTAAAEEERDQCRIAEQHQMGLRQKAEDERDALAEHLDEVQRLADHWVQNEQTLAATWELARKVGKWSLSAPATNLAQRDTKAQLNILRDCIGELTSEALKTHRIGQQYTADMAMALITRKCHALHHRAGGDS